MEQRKFNEQKAVRFKRFVRKSYSAFNSMHRLVNIGVVAGCVLTMINTTTASAQVSASDQPVKSLEKELDEVMVTAARIETPIAQTSKLVTVITKEQLAQAPVQSIGDLLNYAANIDLVQRGGHGVQADISLRGGSADQTAILLNGINISNPQTGHFSLDIPINLSDIERIEIVHGPSALIYGSSAYAGGINIITKKEVDSKAFLKVESGMHKLRGMEFRGAIETGSFTHSLSVGNSSSDGYIANSDYDLYNVLWQSRLKLKNSSKIDLQLGYNDKKFGANTFYSPKYPNQYEQTSTYMGTVKGEFGTKLKIVPIIYWNRHHDEFELIKGSDVGHNYHRIDTYGANLNLAYKSQYGTTNLGSEIRREDLMSNNMGKIMVEPHRRYTKYDDRTISTLSLEHTLNIDRIALSAGAILNHNTLDDKYKVHPSVSVSYKPIDGINISSSWSQSSRLPSYTELYLKSDTHEANEGLKSEKSEAVELGLKYNNRFLSLYTTGFLMWGRNVIDWVEVNKDGKNVYASWNHTKVNTQGIESGVKLQLSELTGLLGNNAFVKIDYTRMFQDYDTNNMQSMYALCYLRDKFTAQLNHQIYMGLSASWFFRLQKRMGQYDVYEGMNVIDRKDYPSYSTLDVKLNYKYNDLNIFVNINNIYDTEYFDRGSIPQAGFWLTGGISYTFK